MVLLAVPVVWAAMVPVVVPVARVVLWPMVAAKVLRVRLVWLPVVPGAVPAAMVVLGMTRRRRLMAVLVVMPVPVVPVVPAVVPGARASIPLVVVLVVPVV